jgi:hypothetical protein
MVFEGNGEKLIRRCQEERESPHSLGVCWES